MAQPPPSSLSLRGILTLPYRLCNPPPAIGKVRSCAVTPVLDVRLDDVLARRHLPPIGLKDLEEYLLYVERAPENLYFILWLKDYTTRYQAWVQREKTSLVSRKDMLASRSHRIHNFSVPPTPDPSLAMFYLRAKQTFFTPNGEYELNIPSDILAPFHCTPHAHPWHTRSHDHSRSSLWHSQSVHPDPAVFAEVAIEARSMLGESLGRFVRAAYTNVGSQRAICGIIGGSFFIFVAGVLPLVLTTGRWNIGPHVFLIRLTAFPGLWLGFTILIASLQGVCLMIYVFGDLRQLRKFELARPTISRPIPLPISSPMSSKSAPARRPSLFIPTRPAPMPAPVPMAEKTAGVASPMSSLDSPISFVVPTCPSPAQLSCTSLARSSCESCVSDVCPSEERVEIDVSPAFFDDVPAPEGPATASCLHRPEYRLSPPSLTYMEPVHMRPEMRPYRSSTRPHAVGNYVVDPSQGTRGPRGSVKSSFEYGPTAGFIPNGYPDQSMTSLSETPRSLRGQRNGCHFDFDALPPSRTTHHRHRQRQRLDSTCVGDCCGSASTDPAHQLASSPRGAAGHFFGRAQYKCNQGTSPAMTAALSSSSSSSSSSKYPSCDKSSFSDTSSIRPRRRFAFFATLIPSFTAGVPAFAAPLTEVQSPEVKRAQWEVIVRAALMASLMAGTVTGVVVGVVP